MRLAVLLFAEARVRAGSSAWVVELVEPATVADLKAALIQSCPALGGLIPSSRVAVDATYALDDELIPPGSEVAIIPPVSGGALASRYDFR